MRHPICSSCHFVKHHQAIRIDQQFWIQCLSWRVSPSTVAIHSTTPRFAPSTCRFSAGWGSRPICDPMLAFCCQRHIEFTTAFVLPFAILWRKAPTIMHETARPRQIRIQNNWNYSNSKFKFEFDFKRIERLLTIGWVVFWFGTFRSTRFALGRLCPCDAIADRESSMLFT